MSTYLIGGRLVAGGGLSAGQITIRQLLPRTLRCELTLNKPEAITADIDLPLVDPATGSVIDLPQQLVPGRDFVGVVAGGRLVAAGPVWGDPFSFPYSSKLKAEGLWSYFDRRYVLPVLAPGQLPRDVVSRWSGLSRRTIAKRLVQQAIEHPGAALPIDFEPDVAGPHDAEYLGGDGVRVGQALRDLTEVDGGPDIAFRPYITEDGRNVRWSLVTGEPLVQDGAPHYWDTSAAVPHATVPSLDRDARQLASVAYVTGRTVRNLASDGEFRDGMGSWVAGGANGNVQAMIAGPTELALGAKGYSLTTWSAGSGAGAGGISSTPTITVEPGQWYRISCRAQGTTKPVRLMAQWNTEDTYTTEQVAAGSVVPSEYRRFSGLVQAPPGAVKLGVYLYPQVGQSWAAGNTLRTTLWHVHDDVGEELPYFYDEMQLQARVENPALIVAGFPKLEAWDARSSVGSAATLQGYAEEAAARGAEHVTTRTVRARRDEHPVLGSYLPGDVAKVAVPASGREGKGTTVERIVRVQFTEAGDVSVDLAPQRTSGYPVPSSRESWMSDQLAALSARIDESGRR